MEKDQKKYKIIHTLEESGFSTDEFDYAYKLYKSDDKIINIGYSLGYSYGVNLNFARMAIVYSVTISPKGVDAIVFYKLEQNEIEITIKFIPEIVKKIIDILEKVMANEIIYNDDARRYYFDIEVKKQECGSVIFIAYNGDSSYHFSISEIDI